MLSPDFLFVSVAGKVITLRIISRVQAGHSKLVTQLFFYPSISSIRHLPGRHFIRVDLFSYTHPNSSRAHFKTPWRQEITRVCYGNRNDGYFRFLRDPESPAMKPQQGRGSSVHGPFRENKDRNTVPREFHQSFHALVSALPARSVHDYCQPRDDPSENGNF